MDSFSLHQLQFKSIAYQPYLPKTVIFSYLMLNQFNDKKLNDYDILEWSFTR